MVFKGSAVSKELLQASGAPLVVPSAPLQESSHLQITSFGRGEWPIVEMTACTYQDPVPQDYKDLCLASCYQGWGIFRVKHITIQRRGHQWAQEGNVVQCARAYTFLFMESAQREAVMD